MVTGLRDANYYGYNAYVGDEPTLDVDLADRVLSGSREARAAATLSAGAMLVATACG